MAHAIAFRGSVRLALLLAFGLTAGCRAQLDSDLPTGPAAIAAIEAQTATQLPSAYLLRPGDVIGVSVFRENDLSRDRVQIDQAGQIVLPLVGSIDAAGLSPADLAALVEGRYGARYLRNPDVSVTLVEGRADTIAVEGSVESPGIYPVQPGYTLLSAMALAGSPTDTAKLDEVLVFRQINGQRAGARFDLADIRAGRSPDPQLLPGDTVVVGYSNLRGAYRDIVSLNPLTTLFVLF